MQSKSTFQPVKNEKSVFESEHTGIPRMTEEDAAAQREPEAAPTENVIWWATKAVATGIYRVLYSAGGFLSELFGITTPRYAYVLREYDEMQRRQRLREMELAGDPAVLNPKGSSPPA